MFLSNHNQEVSYSGLECFVIRNVSDQRCNKLLAVLLLQVGEALQKQTQHVLRHLLLAPDVCQLQLETLVYHQHQQLQNLHLELKPFVMRSIRQIY